jgi:hypothetical protein
VTQTFSPPVWTFELNVLIEAVSMFVWKWVQPGRTAAASRVKRATGEYKRMLSLEFVTCSVMYDERRVGTKFGGGRQGFFTGGFLANATRKPPQQAAPPSVSGRLPRSWGGPGRFCRVR